MPAKPDEATDPKQAKRADPAERQLGAEDFGLRLTNTIVGDRVRMATINGKPYRENARIAFSRTGERAGNPNLDMNEPMLVLKTVDRKFVVLEHDGKLYQLPLAR